MEKILERIGVGGSVMALIYFIYLVFSWAVLAYVVGALIVAYLIGSLLDKLGINPYKRR